MPLTYLQWNDILGKHFFNENRAGEEVILFANKDTIEGIGSQYNENFNDFKQLVIEGPPWVIYNNGLCNKAYNCYLGWRKRGTYYLPPYIAYLVFFVYVATIDGEGNFDTRAYYPRLWTELGEENPSRPFPHFDKMDELWEDLQVWTEEDTHESLGRFTLRRRYEAWRHVGIPLSQILLSDEEREKLPLFFVRSELDPSDIPSDNTILQKLRDFGPGLLERRTLNMVNSPKREHKEFQNALIELVLSSLRDWDGTYEEPDEQQVQLIKTLDAPLSARICFDEIDPLKGRIDFSLRIKSRKEFPVTGLDVRINNSIMTCKGSAYNWSTKLKEHKNGSSIIFNPTSLDWENGASMSDPHGKLHFRLRGSATRVFLRGSHDGIPGWVEAQRVKMKNDYYIICRDAHAGKIRSWGEASNTHFREIQLDGTPEGWAIFWAKDIQASHPEFGVLALPKQSRIYFEGGLRIGKTNHYLKIAPPVVVLDSGTGNDLIRIQNPKTALIPDKKEPLIYHLPPDLPTDKPIIIELVGKDSETIQKRTIFLVKPRDPSSTGMTLFRDNSGEIVRDGMTENGMGNTFSQQVISGIIFHDAQ